MEKPDCRIPEELTPEWWITKTINNDDFIVIPDNVYPHDEKQIVYEHDDVSQGIVENT